jgi:hypothetical protein
LYCFCIFFYLLVWADADTWFERQQQEEEMQRIQGENRAEVREWEKEDETEIKDDPMTRAEAEVLKQNS